MSLPAKIASSIQRVVALCLLCLLCSCAGYTLEADSPSVFGDGSKTLKIKEVDYPTLQPWLPYIIRSGLRDEINTRHLARWVDSGPSDYEIQINVISFTTRGWMRDEIDRNMLFDTAMSMEAIVYDGSTNEEVWRSNSVSYSDRLEQPEERLAAQDLVLQLVRRLADQMRNTF